MKVPDSSFLSRPGLTIRCFVLLLYVALSSGKTGRADSHFQVAQVPSETDLCAVDQPTEVLSERSALRCSAACHHDDECMNFNYIASNKSCHLFSFRPKCYEPSTVCRHYQMQSEQPSLGIPVENCSIPYTYNMQLYNSCVANLTGVPCNFGCLTRNRTLVTCRRQDRNFTAVYVQVNVSIPTINGSTPLRSINNWIVIQQRVDGSLNFTLLWSDYKAGFGNISTNFWLGLERMHQLTSSSRYRLRVELQSLENGNWFSAEYESFRIDSEVKGYALNVSGYVGDAGDALQNSHNCSGTCYHNGHKFSTIDADNDGLVNFDCAANRGGGGWWYDGCSYCNLNNPTDNTRFYWLTITDLGLASVAQLKTCKMMIKTV